MPRFFQLRRRDLTRVFRRFNEMIFEQLFCSVFTRVRKIIIILHVYLPVMRKLPPPQ